MISPLMLLLTAGFLSGVQQLINKHISKSNQRSDSYTTAALLFSTCLSIPFLFVHQEWAHYTTTWIIIAVSVVCYAFSTAFSFAAYKKLDVSAVSLLQRLSVVFIYILGVVFLKENISAKNLIGIALITFGSLTIIYKKSSAHAHLTGVVLAILMALTGAFAAILDKLVLRDFSPYTYLFINNFLVGLVFIPKKGNFTGAIKIIKSQPNSLLVRSLLANMSTALVWVALQAGLVSNVMPVYKTVSLIVPVILGIVLFKERSSLKQKIVGLVLSSVGIYLMYL
jgi:uncharacterized membrane protein